MSHLTDEEKEAKFKKVFERARRGVLEHLDTQGGTLSLEALHDYSLNTFFIQHQRFSEMMETFVDEQLVKFDHANHEATITDKGRDFIKE